MSREVQFSCKSLLEIELWHLEIALKTNWFTSWQPVVLDLFCCVGNWKYGWYNWIIVLSNVVIDLSIIKLCPCFKVWFTVFHCFFEAASAASVRAQCTTQWWRALCKMLFSSVWKLGLCCFGKSTTSSDGRYHIRLLCGLFYNNIAHRSVLLSNIDCKLWHGICPSSF